MTTDHLAMLAWIHRSESPSWTFLSDNYPIGFLWSRVIVSDLLRDLSDAKMILHEDAQSTIQITQAGIKAMQHYKEQAEQEQAIQKMTYEQLSLDVENLRNEFFDYATTKRNSRLALIFSGIAIAVTILIAIFKK
jgi:hypothetical protein